jgi:hypothetical protein
MAPDAQVQAPRIRELRRRLVSARAFGSPVGVKIQVVVRNDRFAGEKRIDAPHTPQPALGGSRSRRLRSSGLDSSITFRPTAA